MRELQLLEALAERSEVSQSALAGLVGLTPARVNAYIQRFVTDGYVVTAQRSRGVSYHLTPAGQHALAFHRVSYRAELVALTRAARSTFRLFFSELRSRGIFRVVLYGAGETGEVVLDALADSEVVTVLAVIDDDVRKQGRTCHGRPIRHRAVIPQLAPDAIVITSITAAAEIRERLRLTDGGLDIPIVTIAGPETEPGSFPAAVRDVPPAAAGDVALAHDHP